MTVRTLAFVMLAYSAGVLGLIGLADLSGLRINLTPSLPIGLWRIATMQIPPARGDTVSFCPPDTAIFRDAFQRGIISRGRCRNGWAPMLKPIVAILGDEVEIRKDALVVNGGTIPSSARRIELEGSLAYGAYGVRTGEIWVLAPQHLGSFDSRYFGPVPLELIEGAARPILTWR